MIDQSMSNDGLFRPAVRPENVKQRRMRMRHINASKPGSPSLDIELAESGSRRLNSSDRLHPTVRVERASPRLYRRKKRSRRCFYVPEIQRRLDLLLRRKPLARDIVAGIASFLLIALGIFSIISSIFHKAGDQRISKGARRPKKVFDKQLQFASTFNLIFSSEVVSGALTYLPIDSIFDFREEDASGQRELRDYGGLEIILLKSDKDKRKILEAELVAQGDEYREPFSPRDDDLDL